MILKFLGKYKVFFHIYFLIVNISLKIQPKYFRFSLIMPRICIEGTVSQNFNLGLSFHFMSLRINVMKNITKGFPFFIIK